VFLGLRWPEPEGLRFRRMPSIAASTQAESCVSVKQKAPGQDGGDGAGAKLRARPGKVGSTSRTYSGRMPSGCQSHHPRSRSGASGEGRSELCCLVRV
jgi:hypothetical protein